MDILKYVAKIISNDSIINSLINNRIYNYELTEVDDTSGPFIVLTPVYDKPSSYVSDKYLSETYLLQIDVETYNHQETIDITKHIRYLMWQKNMKQVSTELDKYFEKTRRYVMSRRYKGIPKNQYYKGERVE